MQKTTFFRLRLYHIDVCGSLYPLELLSNALAFYKLPTGKWGSSEIVGQVENAGASRKDEHFRLI